VVQQSPDLQNTPKESSQLDCSSFETK